jgi:hypothetical protein
LNFDIVWVKITSGLTQVVVGSIKKVVGYNLMF